MLFDIKNCIFASLWRSIVNVGLNVILKDIDKSKSNIAELNSGKRQEVVRHDIWFLHCPPCRYLVNLFIYNYLLKGLYGLLQIIFVLIVRLMGDGLDPY